MLKGSITFGKGLAITGSLGSLFSFFGLGEGLKGRERIFEVVSTVKNTDWSTGYVTPVFNSSWLGGAFENQTEYSYGYVARVDGTDFFEEGNAKKRIRRNLETGSQEEPEARLTLVESINGRSKAEEKQSGGLTPKKFLLVGSNKLTGEVEVTGLVSLIQYQHGGIKQKCKKAEEYGGIRNGFCDNTIFQEYSDTSSMPKFIKEELKYSGGNKSLIFMQLQPKGKSLGVVWGQKEEKNKEKRWSRTGYLYLKDSSSSNKARKVWTQLQEQGKKSAGFFVVHDLIFSENGMGREWVEKKAKWGTILVEGIKSNTNCSKTGNVGVECGKVIDIPLSSRRNYYIWDPSKTKIKNGEFITDDGIKLPFKLNFDATWSSSLVK